jgi:hypothetical protein
MSRDLLFFLLGTLFIIPFGIATNILTPKYLDFMGKRSLSARGKRLQTLIKEFKEVQDYERDKNRLILVALRRIALSLSSIASLILLFGIFSLVGVGDASPSGQTGESLTPNIRILGIGCVALAFAITYSLTKVTETLYRVINFKSYQQSVFTRIKELGGNVEELLKEDEAESSTP